MLQKLAGRIQSEPTATGIHIEIAAPGGWFIPLLLIWLAGWTYGGYMLVPFAIGSHKVPVYILLAGWTAGEIYMPPYLLWSLFGHTTVLLEPPALSIDNTILGYNFRRRSFSTTDIRNLRYQPPVRAARSYRPSYLSFESAGKTVRFASGLTDAEALGLITKMREIVPFPA